MSKFPSKSIDDGSVFVDQRSTKRRASIFINKITGNSGKQNNKKSINLNEIKENFKMMTGRSLCLFSKNNKIRRLIYKLVINPKFEWAIILVIVVSSI